MGVPIKSVSDLTDKWNTGLIVPGIIRENWAGIFRLAKRARIRLVALDGECRRHGPYRQRPVMNEQVRHLIVIRLSLAHVSSPFAFGADRHPGNLPGGFALSPSPVDNLPQSQIAFSLDFFSLQAV
jgi:hypothetical protein